MKTKSPPAKWTETELNQILKESFSINNIGNRIDFLSGMFLGTSYKPASLIGSADRTERFVVNLKGVDCMTFVEYVEAMRLSDSSSEFIKNLKKVRYKHGKAAFKNRNHFFTDWIGSGFVEDATLKTGGKMAIKVQKRLNSKDAAADTAHKNKVCIIQGIPVINRDIIYLPVKYVDSSILNKLKTGDYAGMYSQEAGLDVSHVGIIIKKKGQVYLRHASATAGKVIDEDFKGYIAKTEGLIVFRPKTLIQTK